ncbi:MAG: putative photosynthetic complex assembly protein PuhE [Pseudomonadota bacterium]
MSVALPIALAVGLWWLTTILLLWRMRLPTNTFAATMGIATALGLAGCAGFWVSLGDATVVGAYIAFASALAIWCWHETSYFLAFITGPRPEACPPDASGWQRFVFGVRASLYHELAIIATAVGMLILAAGADNTIGVQTFVVFWLMRWSTKLNIFFGVSNLHEHFWPERLRYLSSYVAARNGNGFFPISIALAALLAWWVSQPLATAAAGTFPATGAWLVLTLLGLACLEHVFLMLPIPDEVLWRWGLGTPAPAGAARKSIHRL